VLRSLIPLRKTLMKSKTKPRRHVRATSSSRSVTRAEFDALRYLVEKMCRDLDVQFQRIAALQAQVDSLVAKRVDVVTPASVRRQSDDALVTPVPPSTGLEKPKPGGRR
jgi:hypothetical protein